MDSDRKRRIRLISIPLFWIAEVYLLVSLVVGFYVKYYEEELPEAMIGAHAIAQLGMADELMMKTEARLFKQKEENLTRFLPPQNRTDLSLWAAQIQEQMDVECAVFLFDGKTMRWPLLPAQFESRVAHVDSVVRLQFAEDTVHVKQLGNFRMLMIPSGEGEHTRAILIRPLDSELTWGVVYIVYDSFMISFAHKLATSRSFSVDPELGEFSAVFDMQRNATRPGSVASKSKFGLQIFAQSDSLLFETPGIDTSYHKFQQRHDELPTYSIVYLPRWSEDFLRMVKEEFQEEFSIPWFKILITMFVMIILALFYFWIGRLTAQQ